MARVLFVGGPYHGITVHVSDTDDLQAQIDDRTSRRGAAAKIAGRYICDETAPDSYSGPGVLLEAHWESDDRHPAA